jgi:uncharacterized membrane protein
VSEIVFAACLWVFTHLGISSTPLRRILIQAIGEKAYLGVYSLIAAGALGYLIWVYGSVPRFDYLWLPNPDLYWVTKLTMPIAFVLLVGGFMVKNPTNVGMTIEGPQQALDMARGVTRITRHPLQWAIVLWASGHMVANGDLVSLVFFGSFLVLSLLGSVLMDQKKAATMGENWSAYAGVTSNVPFAAIFTGRNSFNIKELALPVVVGLLVHVLASYFHESYTGAVII